MHTEGFIQSGDEAQQMWVCGYGFLNIFKVRLRARVVCGHSIFVPASRVASELEYMLTSQISTHQPCKRKQTTMALAMKLLIIVLVLYITRLIYTFGQNIAEAQAIGVTVKIIPVDQGNVLWLMLSNPIRHLSRRVLPEGASRRLNLAIFGWEFGEKRRPFDDLSTSPDAPHRHSYILAGLKKLELWTIDPEAIQDVLHRTHAFEVPSTLAFALGQFGPNVMTTNGPIWARHRRIVSSVIDERISKTVFEESIQQSLGLLDELFADSSPDFSTAETLDLFNMLKKLTIHVLMVSGMGKEVPWQDGKHDTPEPGYTMSSIESLNTVVANLVGLGIFPTAILLKWPRWLPWYRIMTKVGHAKDEVAKRTRSMLKERYEQQDQMARSDANIISKLVHASESIASGQSLSEDEMVSNLFIFTAAGFETTATTLAYAMVLLARYPLWQTWIFEEVDALLSESKSAVSEYADIFPRANRTMAFMLEIVRLYPPAPHIHREITSPQTLQTSSGTIQLPAGMRIYIDSVAVHLSPSWRDINHASDPAALELDPDVPDELIFRPSRWINPSSSSTTIFRPAKGTFVPWAAGARVCPGQKMAQVEFVAVMMTVLRKCKVEAVPLSGEHSHDVMNRLDQRLDNSVWRTVLEIEDIFRPSHEKGLNMRLVQRD
jgi:cytochrome P450